LKVFQHYFLKFLGISQKGSKFITQLKNKVSQKKGGASMAEKKAVKKKKSVEHSVNVESGLNPRQERFCEEYLIDFNGTQAAIRAGYSKKTANSQAPRLLANVSIRSRVRALQQEQTERLMISQDWVLQQLVEVVKKSNKVIPVQEWDYEEKCMVDTGEFQFDSRGATKGLELIGKHLGMFIDKMEVTTTGVTIVNDIPESDDGDNNGNSS